MSDDHKNKQLRPCSTIVLTGASGYLGQHCLRALIDSNRSTTTKHKKSTRHIHALIHQSSKADAFYEAIQTYIQNGNSISSTNTDVVVTVTALDITSARDCQAWAESLPKNTPDCCIHTAALSSPTVCEEQPSLAAAINVPRHFLSLLFQSNPNIRMIAISTDQVYDGQQSSQKGGEARYMEESPTNPCNVYGTTKVQLEDYLLKLHSQQKPNFPESTLFLLRSSILLGPLAPFLDAHSTFLHLIAHQAAITTTTTYYTNERRSVLAVADAVRILLHLADDSTTMDDASEAVSVPSGVYCMGGPGSVSRYDMAVAVLQHLGKDVASLAVPAVKAATTTTTPTTTTMNDGSNNTNNNNNEPKNGPSSPLDITMDSSKLLRQVTSGTTPKFATLTEMVASTFGVPSQTL